MRHVARDGQAKAATDHIAQEVEQDIVEIPVMEAQLFEKLETMDDPATTAAAPNLGAAKLHRENTAALEADIADFHFLACQLFLGRGFDNRGASLAAKQQRGGIRFRVAADQQHALSLFGHHVAEVCEREALADAALAVDRDDLRFLGRLALRHLERGLIGFFAQLGVIITQVWNIEAHAAFSLFGPTASLLEDVQFRIIFRQAGSSNAV